MLAPAKARIYTSVMGLLFAVGMVLSGCSSSQLPKGVIGRMGRYDYSPSVIQTGNVKQFWWCGLAQNPTDSSQETDAILYESVDSVSGQTKGPWTVLAETRGAWDASFTCNPKVIGGTFVNPLGDGATYSYAMYYVGINQSSNNNIGVAFSGDGIHWKKYPQPVIWADNGIGYGVGQPSLINSDHKAAITMFYEDSYPAAHHVKATSNDGIHFTVQGSITHKGLDPGCPGQWGDMAFDPKTGYWYALFNRDIRAPDTTGGVIERGQYGVELYRIPDRTLFSGDVPWQLLATFDTNVTGFESNFIGAIVRDQFGSVVVGSYPALEMYLSVSDPQPGWNYSAKEAGKSADPSTWDIAPVKWVPGQGPRALTQYSNGKSYLVTTGWVSPFAGFKQNSVVGHLHATPATGATNRLYACKKGSEDSFLSLDPACGGSRIIGTSGFAYPQAQSQLVPLYQCMSPRGHFVSRDPKCQGQQEEEFLGYILP